MTTPDPGGSSDLSVARAPLDVDLTNVTLRFASPGAGAAKTIYEGFDLAVERGSFTVILGPSGCGKSTLLNIIDGLMMPTSADRLTVLGKDIRENPEVTKNCAYVFQSARLLKWKTLKDNVKFGLKGLGIQPKERWDALIDQYFSAVGLADYTDYYPHQVSGGMQQRAAIVRAWANEPQILLMDEPFSHLDEFTAAELRTELVRLWRGEEQRRTVVFVTHSIAEAVQLGTRILVLTPQPASVCHEEHIEADLDVEDSPDDAFEVERKIRQIFIERAGIYV